MAALAQMITTLVVGLVAAYVAWRQWRTAHDRLMLDLFERRFQSFQELTQVVSTALSKPHPDANDLADFDRASQKARFLFGPEVYAYLGQMRVHLVTLIGRGLRDMPHGPASVENLVTPALTELSSFYGRLAKVVTRYLQMPVGH
jgi:hypothetical protein